MSQFVVLTSAKAKVMRSVLFVCPPVSRIIAKVMSQFQWANELKLGVVIWLTNHKNWLTFGGDTVPDTDSRSLLRFRHRCEIEDLRFISVSHTVTGRFSRHSAKWVTDAGKAMIVSTIFLGATRHTPIRSRINPKFRITFGWGQTHWRRFALSEHSL